MFIDTHIHENRFSSDSSINLNDIVNESQRLGLDGICITDHESNYIYDIAMEYSKKRNFLIIVGSEILTYEGDILVFGMNNVPKEKLHAQELIDLVTDSGGICIAAHPFRRNRSLGFNIRNLTGLTGIECFNGNTDKFRNIYAYGLAVEQNLSMLGGSDAHLFKNIGKCCTYFPTKIENELEFINAIKSRNTKPAIFNGVSYEIINIRDIYDNNKI